MVSIAEGQRAAHTTEPQVNTPERNQLAEAKASGPDAGNLRKNLMRGAQSQTHQTESTPPSIDLSPLKEKIGDLVNHEAYRGLPQEKRTQLIDQQLEKLSNLSAEQRGELRAEFERLDQDAAERRDRELQETMSRLVQETSQGAFNETKLQKAYTELSRVAGKGTSQDEWASIRADFEQQRNDIRRSAMIQEIRTLGRSSVVLGESLDRNKTANAIAQIQERYADVGLSGKEVSSHLKSSYEAHYHTKLSKAGFFSRQYYKASRWLDETGDWLASSFDRAKQAAQAAVSRVKAFGKGVLETGEAVLNELADAGNGLVRLGNKALDVALELREKAIDGIKAAGTAVGEFAYEVITDPKAAATKVINTAIAVKDAVVSTHAWAVEKTAQGLLWAADTYASVQTWVRENGMNMLKATGEMLLNVGEGCLQAGWATLQTGWNLAKVACGQMTWENFKTASVAAWSGAVTSFSAAGSILYAGVSTAGGFLKSVSDSIGLTDLAVGIYHNTVMVPHLLYDLGLCAIGKQSLSGALSNAAHHMSQSARALVGAVKCLGEVTGITDALMAGKHLVHALAAYGRGEDMQALAHLGQAAMHGAFAVMSAGAIAATVATGGAAAGSVAAVMAGRMAAKEAAKAVLKTAAKEFFEKGAKEIGELALKKLGGEALSLVSKEMGTAAAKELEQQAIKELGAGASKEATTALVERLALQKLIQREGVATAKELGETLSKKAPGELTTDTVRELGSEIGERRTSELLKQLKLSETVDELVFDALKNLDTMSPRQARAHLIDTFGVSKREANRMAREAKKALRTGKADNAIKQVYEDGITKQISEVIQTDMEQSFKETFGKALRGQLDEPWSRTLAKNVDSQAKKLGKTVDEFSDELVEAGWKGVKEGIESATRKLVREGIENAFKRFRARSAKVLPRKESDAIEHEAEPTTLAKEEASATEAVEAVADEKKEAILNKGESVPTRQFTINQADGTTVVITEVLDIATNKWIPAGKEVVSKPTISLAKEEPPKMKGATDSRSLAA